MDTAFRLTRLRRSLLPQFVLLLLLSDIVTSAAALDMTRYYPLTPGNQWSYRSDYRDTETVTVGSAVVLPSGVSAFPVNTVSRLYMQSNTGYTQGYFTNDSDGLREHYEYASAIPVSGVGNIPASLTLSPPALYSPRVPTVGGNYTSTGILTMTIGNLDFPLNYRFDTRVTGFESVTNYSDVIGFESVTNYSGTRSWLAVKVVQSMTISGTINGHFISDDTMETIWLVDGIGIVQMLRPRSSGGMETWQLASTNVVPPVPTNPLLHPFVFDPAFYLGAYSDLQHAFGWNPEEAQNHWINAGIREGRMASPEFSVNWYKYRNPDLSVLGGNNELLVRHYVQFGIREGRESAVNFSVRDYLSFYPDLTGAFGTNYSAATSHYISSGMREGRRSSRYFDPRQYLVNNRDLATAFGSDYTAATMHYILYGVLEGRAVASGYPIAPRTFHP